MQKQEYPENHRYAKRGIYDNSGYTDMYDTQYGHNSTYCRLQLHMGNHQFRKRGGVHEAFMPDRIDYRYESLAKSLGVNVAPDKMVGAFIGHYCGRGDDNVICFRVSEDAPSDVVYLWRYEEDIFHKVLNLDPLAISAAQYYKWFQAVFSLDRKNTEGPSDEFFDETYDYAPDAVDCCESHWCDDVPGDEIALLRLRLCGFDPCVF